MDKFIGIIEQKIMPVANRIGTQRHMTAIRKGIIATMPLTIVGSFFTILLNIPIESVAAVIEPYREILDIPFRYTVGILALYATFGIASSLAKSYRLDSLTAGILALMSFLIVAALPTRILEDMGEVTAGRYINIANLGSGSLFGAIVTAIISVEIYRFFIKKKITIRTMGIHWCIVSWFFCHRNNHFIIEKTSRSECRNHPRRKRGRRHILG